MSIFAGEDANDSHALISCRRESRLNRAEEFFKQYGQLNYVNGERFAHNVLSCLIWFFGILKMIKAPKVNSTVQ
jgi:hypothetical protein